MPVYALLHDRTKYAMWSTGSSKSDMSSDGMPSGCRILWRTYTSAIWVNRILSEWTLMAVITTYKDVLGVDILSRQFRAVSAGRAVQLRTDCNRLCSSVVYENFNLIIRFFWWCDTDYQEKNWWRGVQTNKVEPQPQNHQPPRESWLKWCVKKNAALLLMLVL